MNVTMQQVAQRAGVSQATVSLALAGKPRISNATRQKILQIAEDIGYAPDPRLTTLVERRWRKRSAPDGGNRLAVLVPEGRPESAMLPAIEERARQLGYGIDVLPLGDSVDYESIVTARGIRAALVIQAGDFSQLRGWNPRSLAVVQCGVVNRSTGFHSVLPDLLNASQQLVNRILQSQYHRVGFGTFADTGTAIDMLRQAAIGLMREQLRDRCLPEPAFTMTKEMKDQFPKWAQEKSPDLIIGMNDFFAVKLQIAGWDLPGQIACASLTTSESNPWITGFRPDLVQVARRSVEMVAASLARLEFGTPTSPETVLVSSTWQPGTSVIF